LKPVVGILMGSDSDLDVMEEAAGILKTFRIPFEMTISSAHRTPGRTLRYARGAERRGIKVIIAGAGSAAHLAGFIAAETTLPVIGVPIASSALKGLDSLLSTAQMPAGVPVATMAIGKAGARNAGVLAAQIIGLTDDIVRAALKDYKRSLARQVEEKAKRLKV
jgi:phosphoribosylaminoimidazole carboxylase PurE protein